MKVDQSHDFDVEAYIADAFMPERVLSKMGYVKVRTVKVKTGGIDVHWDKCIDADTYFEIRLFESNVHVDAYTDYTLSQRAGGKWSHFSATCSVLDMKKHLVFWERCQKMSQASRQAVLNGV